MGAMRTSPRLFVCVAFLLGCGAEPQKAGPDPEGGTGGEATGGKTSTGTGGSKATGGAGGTVTATGGAGGSNPQSFPDAAAPAADSAPPAAADAGAPPTNAGEAPYGCTTCRRLFDGKTLDGWVTVDGAWVVKDGAMASTGKANDIFTKEDIGDARIFFQVRQISGNHKPCTTLFGNRPAGTSGSRGLSGAQFQPPNGASWDYGAGGTFKRLLNPNFDVKKWHQCEILIKEAGSFRAACCPVGPRSE